MFFFSLCLRLFSENIINTNWEKKKGVQLSPVPGKPVLALGGDPTSGAVWPVSSIKSVPVSAALIPNVSPSGAHSDVLLQARGSLGGARGWRYILTDGCPCVCVCDSMYEWVIAVRLSSRFSTLSNDSNDRVRSEHFTVTEDTLTFLLSTQSVGTVMIIREHRACSHNYASLGSWCLIRLKWPH